MRLPAILFASAALVASTAHAADPKPLIFGLQRTISADDATKQSAVLEGYLTGAMKRPVTTKVFGTYDELADALAKGDIDVGWMNPLPFVRATQAQPGIQAIAKAIRHGSSYYRSVVFVRASNNAKGLMDLSGTKAAWTDKDSASGYLYARAMFQKAGAKLPTFFSSESFKETHQAVCQAVLSGEADFGATFETGAENKEMHIDGCLTSLGDSVGDKLRALVASDPIPNEVVAVKSGFDADLAATLGSVFGQMSQTEAGRKILNEVFDAEGFGAVLESDFDSVKAVLAGPAPAKKTDTASATTSKRKSKKKQKEE